METPCLTEKTCRKRTFAPLLFLPLIFLLFTLIRPIHRPTAFVLLLIFISVFGLLIGEALGWIFIQGKIRRGSQIVDPRRESVPSEAGLLLRQARFALTSTCWILSMSSMIISMLQRSPVEMRLIYSFVSVLIIFLTGITTAVTVRSLHIYKRRYKESQKIANIIEIPDVPIVESANWWTKDETRQEIRRR